VADRVRDEVGSEPLEEVRIADRPRRLEYHDPLESAQVMIPKRFGSDRREIDRFAALRLASAPGKGKACLEQPFLLSTRSKNVLADLSPAAHVRVRIGECEFKEGALGCEGRAQLVCHVGCEALFALDHRAHEPLGLL
jgi:hypothetical protein